MYSRPENSTEPPSHVVIALTNCAHYSVHRHFVREQGVGIEVYLVLADKSPDRGHFGNARQRLDFVFQKPVLNRAQLRKIMLAGLVHERVLKYPPNGRLIGASST